MLERRVSPYPGFIFTALTVYFACVATGITHASLDWREASVYLAFACGFFAVLYAAIWLGDSVTRIANLTTVIRAGIVDAIRTTDHDGRVLIAWVLGFAADEEYPNEIDLPGGGTIAADTLESIAAGVTAEGELQPERSYQVSQMNTRRGYDVLETAGLITPARGNRRARIKDYQKFAALIEKLGKK